MRISTSTLAAALLLAAGTMTAAPADAVTGWHAYATAQPSADFSYQMRYLYGVVAFSASNAWSVGSYDDHVHNVSVPLVEHWTGSSWQRVFPPTVRGGSSLRYLSATGPADIWAAGYGGPTAPNVYLVHRNAFGWHRATTTGLDARFSMWSLAAGGPNNVWLGGYNLSSQQAEVEHWNGSRWTSSFLPVGPGTTGGQISGLTMIPGTGRPEAVGATYTNTASQSRPYAAVWTGTAWRRQPTPAGNAVLRSVRMLSATAGWAVGTRYPNANDFETYALHWNGTAWSVSGTPNRAGDNTVLSVDARGPADAWAVGYSTCLRCSAWHTLAEHWNGRSWTISATVDPRWSKYAGNALWSVAIVPGTNQTWAVGQAGPARPGYAAEYTLAERDN